MATKRRYCPLCGDTGIDIDNKVCSCRLDVREMFETVSCLDVPEQYRGVTFSKFLLPNDLPDNISNFMENMHTSMLTGDWKMHNVVIATPTGYGKSILAYSCLESLCRLKMETFPVMDVLELKRVMTDLDLGRKQLYEIENPDRLFTVPVLFTKVPHIRGKEVFGVMSLLLDRRVRRGLSTIFLYDGSWQDLTAYDYDGLISNLQGDGTYNTLDVKSWFVKKVQAKGELPEVQFEENRN